MLASSERGAVSIPSSSTCSTKPDISIITTGSRLKDPDSFRKYTSDNNHVRLASADRTDSYSLSSVDVMMDSNDLKYMDDSTSSSSNSSISSGGMAVLSTSNSNSTASLSPTAVQSSHSQDTLKLNARSPLACPLSNGPSNSQPQSSPHTSSATPLVNGKQSTPSRYSLPAYRSEHAPKPSRIPVLTSLGRVRSTMNTRNGSDTHADESSLNGDHCSPSHSPTNTSLRSPIQQHSATKMHTALTDPISIDGLNSLKLPHSPPEHIPSSSPLPNGDVPRLFCEVPSPERSPAALLRSVNRDDPSSVAKVTNGFCGSEFEEDNRFREFLAMVSDSESDTESIAESIYHQPPKAADRSAASRLAKRLFHLDGFRITDVAKHLCKRNDFSQLVGEEFASLFDFANQRLDTALRTFLNTFSLTGESQERERILLHFSRRYYACNPGAYPNEEVCHTLVCALMLLNTDLHNPGVTRKMTCPEFINNLNQMHCGDCFSREELKTLYNAIKQEPLRWPHADSAMMGFVNLYYPGNPQGPFYPPGSTTSGILTPAGFYPHPAHPNAPMMFGPQPGHPNSFNPYSPMLHPSFQSPCTVTGQVGSVNTTGAVSQAALLGTNPPGYTSPFYWNGSSITSSQLNLNTANPANALVGEFSGNTKTNLITGTNPYIDLTAETNAREYMRGLLVRKWVMESHGKKTSLGRRGWKVYYARLRDLVLYLYKNAMVANAAARAEELHNLHQQQLQQHQNYMRQLAIQQQQQQHLALLQAQASELSARPDPVNGDVKTDGEGDAPASSFLTMPTPTVTTTASDSNNSTTVLSHSSPNDAQPESMNGDIDFSSTSDHPGSDVPVSNHSQSTSSISDRQTEIQTSQFCTVPSYTFTSSAALSTSTATNSSNNPGSMHTSEATNSLGGSAMSVPSPLSYPAPPLPGQTPLSFPAPPSFIPPSIPPPEAVIRIAHAIASRATDYSKKPNVFRLKTRDGAEYLFEVSDAKELDMWVERINFVAALLSAPSMPGPISSERGFYRPHLPVTCTKLNMREQLEEHQRRLIELGRELSDLQKRCPIVSGSKTLKPSRASSLSGRTSDATKSAVTAAAGSKVTSCATSNVEGSPNEMKENISQPDSESTVNTERTDDATESNSSTTAVSTSSPNAAAPSSSSSFISVFSTSSLGRRRKTSSGSLCGTGDSTLGLVLTAKQRAEHEERTQFTESEINRYKTYARLLEAELFRIQQSSAAVAHAAALAAANNFSPYMNPYGALPGPLPGFQHYGPIGIGSGGMPFPSPLAGPPPRYFVPRDPSATYAAPGMLPLAVFGSSDPLTEESSNSETPSDSVNTPPVVTSPSSVGLENPPVPAVYSAPPTLSIDPRHRSLPYSCYGPHLAPPTPYSPSVSGRFYANPRQLRNPHHYRQQLQHGFNAPSGFSRTNGLLSFNGGHHLLAEEDPISSESPPSPSADSAFSTTSENSEQPASSLAGSTDKFKLAPQSSSSQPLCSTEGMFYEIV